MAEKKKFTDRISFDTFKKEYKKYGVKKARSFELIIHWLKSIMTRNQFLVLSGILVGCSAGLAGVVLKALAHYIYTAISGDFYFSYRIFFYAVFPFIGIVLTAAIVKFFFKGEERKGIPQLLNEIAQKSSVVSPVKMYSQVIQSAVTVGFGGSVGLESPIAVTGSAIGSNYAQTYGLGYKERTLLLAAGATAGIASAFNAPIAGTMFAFEILLTGVVFSDFIPLIIAAVCGSLLSRVILGDDILFTFGSVEKFDFKNIIYYLGLGIVTGLYARYFVVVSHKIDKFFSKLKISKINKAVIGGIIVSALCVLYPPFFGEGYQSVKELAGGNVQGLIANSFFSGISYNIWLPFIFIGSICLLKVIASAVTLYSGGNGGNFAPSLFAGAFVGYFFSITLGLMGFQNLPVTNFVVVGMAGVMSGVLYAPLTAIFLIAEASSGYDLFIPLMIVSVSSFLIGKWFSPLSPDLISLAEEGKIFTRQHDRNILSLLKVSGVYENDVQTINMNAKFRDLIALIKIGKRNFIAVLGNNESLEGIITLDDVRPRMFDQNLYDTLEVKEIMKPPPAVIDIKENIQDIVNIFDELKVWNLPVVDGKHYVGFISKSGILNRYRELLKEYSN